MARKSRSTKRRGHSRRRNVRFKIGGKQMKGFSTFLFGLIIAVAVIAVLVYVGGWVGAHQKAWELEANGTAILAL
jgi:nitrogen fixation protein FixH